MTCCEATSNGQSRDGGDPTPADLLASQIYADIDITQVSSGPFGDGVHVLDGVEFTAVQTALAGSIARVAGRGIAWTAAAAARTWSLASLTTAPYFYTTLEQIEADRDVAIDYQKPIQVEMLLGSQLYTNGNDAVRLGLWSLAGSAPAGNPYITSAARLRMVDVGSFGGTSTVRYFDGTTPFTATEAPIAVQDIGGIRVAPEGTAQTYRGQWSGEWPMRFQNMIRTNTAMGTVDPPLTPTTRIVIPFINSAGSGATSDVMRIRVRQG